KPALILADEPTGNLDLANALKILELLESFKDRNTTVIITTHATHLISGTNEVRLLHVNKGRISAGERLG
ncbi:MAG TPA: ABC transporter, partial [Clostridia bacterium]|nr:ABC transporter [Clostridia bacterium]